MSVKIYIPGDSGAVALGADRLAIHMAEAVKARDLDVEIIRNGSRGLYWLESRSRRTRAGLPTVRSGRLISMDCLMRGWSRAAIIDFVSVRRKISRS